MACNHVAIMLRQRRREYNSLAMHLLLRLELNIFSLDSATCYLRVMDSHIREGIHRRVQFSLMQKFTKRAS